MLPLSRAVTSGRTQNRKSSPTAEHLRRVTREVRTTAGMWKIQPGRMAARQFIAGKGGVYRREGIKMSEREILPEIQCAAKWWADRLRGPSLQDNGDEDQSMLASYVSLRVAQANAPVSDEEYQAIRRSFERAFTASFVDGEFGGWERAKTDPNWGCASRVASVDYGPDGVLRSALESALPDLDPRRAAMFSLFWPIKTYMRVSPGSVQVSYGYRAEPVEIFNATR